jgi:hypothetical protein
MGGGSVEQGLRGSETVHTTVCQICGAKNETSTAYDDFDCFCCGQAYVYEEGICIFLTPEQKRLLCDHWLKANWPKTFADLTPKTPDEKKEKP